MMRTFTLVLVLLASSAAAAVLPDPRLAPGEVRPGVKLGELCGEARIRTRDVRHVTTAMKKAVFKRDGVAWEKRASYEVDHKIPLSLGGANTLSNLWVQPWNAPGAHEKDRLEVRATREVCHGRIPLEEAQRGFARDWTAFYRKLFGTAPAAAEKAGSRR